ncbi:MAG: NADH dehydrogenase [Alphaproteobacteria bacterium RIFOXYD12_FULL_60_8]|nr:MAG: NADH dehydrogenase [Alphaproteobacteria bacterium RIFOXYD12_FULL_60_8]
MSGDVMQPESFAFSPENLTKVDTILAKYPQGRNSACMPLLDLAQRQEGWLTRAAMDHVANLLGMPPIKVYEVATFYTMYNLNPVGDHHVQICTNICCQIRNSDDIVRAAREVFGVDMGDTTRDGKATVREVECLGACCNAPMMQINDDYYEDLDYDNAKKIFQAILKGEKLKPGSAKGRQGSAPEGGLTTLTHKGGK